VRSAGTHHTQWCDQEIGEISKAANAFRDSAQQSSAAAKARFIPIQAAAKTRADRASQAAAPAVVSGSSPARVRTA